MWSKKMGPSPKSPKARRVVLTTPQKYSYSAGLRCDPCYRMFVGYIFHGWIHAQRSMICCTTTRCINT